MQKIIYIKGHKGIDVKELGEKGWRVVSINPASCGNEIAAYILLEKDDSEGNDE